MSVCRRSCLEPPPEPFSSSGRIEPEPLSKSSGRQESSPEPLTRKWGRLRPSLSPHRCAHPPEHSHPILAPHTTFCPLPYQPQTRRRLAPDSPQASPALAPDYPELPGGGRHICTPRPHLCQVLWARHQQSNYAHSSSSLATSRTMCLPCELSSARASRTMKDDSKACRCSLS